MNSTTFANISSDMATSEFGIKRICVSPGMAKDWYETKNAKNQRALSNVYINSLTSTIVKGRWVPEACTITFDCDGMMINGQHQAISIWKSGLTVDCVIHVGCPTSVMRVLDTNRPRPLTAIEKIVGKSQPNQAQRNSIIRSLMLLSRGYLGHRRIVVTIDDVDEMEDIYGNVITWALGYMHSRTNRLPSPVMGPMVWLSNSADSIPNWTRNNRNPISTLTLVNDFVTQLYTGVGITNRSSPVKALDGYLKRHPSNTSWKAQADISLATMTCCMDFCQECLRSSVAYPPTDRAYKYYLGLFE